MGYPHRDLSLENILIDQNGVCKLCDFGLVVPITRLENHAVGKTRYMAPELVCPNRTERYSPAPVDIWSLGIILFVLVTNYFPFKKADRSCDRFQNFCKFGLEAFEIQDIVSATALDLLKQMLQVQPENRPSISQVLSHPYFNVDTSQLLNTRK